MTEAESIAKRIKALDIWDDDLNRQLCELAGMEDEYDAADGYTFEDVVFRAAKKLNVEII